MFWNEPITLHADLPNWEMSFKDFQIVTYSCTMPCEYISKEITKVEGVALKHNMLLKDRWIYKQGGGGGLGPYKREVLCVLMSLHTFNHNCQHV